MALVKLSGEKRNTELKAKQLLKERMVPAVVYGKNIDTMNIQIEMVDVLRFLKGNDTGSRATIKMGKKEIPVILKDIQRNPVQYDVRHLDFQALTEGEKLKLSIPIQVIGKDNLPTDAVVQELMSEIDIQTVPKHLIDHITVDISKLEIGSTIKVEDLPIVKDKNVEVLTDISNTVLTVLNGSKPDKEVEDTEDEMDMDIV